MVCEEIIDQLLLIIIVMSIIHIHPRVTRTSTRNAPFCNRNPQAAVCSSPESQEDSCRQQPEVAVVEEELKLRSEKETTSPIIQPIIAAVISTVNALRPLTRSCSLNSATVTTDNSSLAEQPLVLLHSHSTQQNVTSLATAPVPSWLELPDSAVTPSLRKNNSKNKEAVFGEVRKSYRKTNRSDISAFSYRKCHDALEGRIVALLNKIVVGKVIQKDVEALTDRLSKMSMKNLNNRYVVSGISFTLKLGRESSFIEEKTLARLSRQFMKMQERIGDSLDCFQEFQSEIKEEDDSVLRDEQKTLFIRRMYEIGKKNFPSMDRAQLRSKVVRQCEHFLDRGQKHAGLMRYLRGEAGRKER